MEQVKVSVVNGDLLQTPCDTAFVKHIQGLTTGPEHMLDEAMGGAFAPLMQEKEKEPRLLVERPDLFPFPLLCIINFHEADLPFTYSSVDSFSRRIIRFAEQEAQATSVATAVHGPGRGLDASEAMETMLTAFTREFNLRRGFQHIREIRFVEKDKGVFRRLQDRMSYLLDRGRTVIRKGKQIVLNPAAADLGIERVSKHLFVAMPYAKEFNNIYLYGIKQPVESRDNLKCERMDQEHFTGDIVRRIKDRICRAELVIADITGNNPNVFFEIGYAAGVEKQVVLVSQKQEIPFDLRTERQITYDPNDIAALAAQLSQALVSVLDDAEP